MTIQYSTAVRNAQLDAFETTVGASAVLKLFSGSVPANCAASNPAGELASLSLPSNWMADAASGVKEKAGTWSGTASASGTAASFRLYASDGVTCHAQGTVGQGTGDLSLDNTSLASGQSITITAFTITRGNA